MTRSLFDADDLVGYVPPAKKREDARVSPRAMRAKSDTRRAAIRGKALSTIDEVVGRIDEGTTTHVVSCASWSTQHTIEHALRQTGPAEVYFATWSISEDGIRSMLDLQADGLITGIHALVDWRIKVRRPEVAQLVKATSDRLCVSSCHAKVTVIRNANWGISIVGSANLTANPRIEACVITEDKPLADWHIEWIDEALAGGKPFGAKGADSDDYDTDGD